MVCTGRHAGDSSSMTSGRVGWRVTPNISCRRAETAGDGAVAAGPLADALAAEAVGVQGAQVALGEGQREADARLARVAVEVGRDEQRRGAERVVGRERGALAAGEEVSWREARPALADAIGIGERERRARGEAGAGAVPHQRAQAPRFGADGGEGRVSARPARQRLEAAGEVTQRAERVPPETVSGRRPPVRGRNSLSYAQRSGGQRPGKNPWV